MCPTMKKLRLGQSPFDEMSREELIEHCRRMFSAGQTARSILHRMLGASGGGPFWSRDGAGTHALNKLEASVIPIQQQFDHEDIYRSFYRYADSLLFPGLGMTWMVCECGTLMTSEDGRKETRCLSCHKPMRPMTWDDLKPGDEKNGGQ